MLKDLVLDFVISECRESGIVKQLVLFGSRARGDNKDRSDYDFAIWFNDSATEGNRAKLVLDIQDNSPTLAKLDIIEVTTTLDFNLIENIQKEGKILFKASPEAS